MKRPHWKLTLPWRRSTRKTPSDRFVWLIDGKVQWDYATGPPPSAPPRFLCTITDPDND